MRKNKAGRHTKITNDIVQKLEQAFSNGFTDSEACLYAGIVKQTLYNYCKKNKEFLDRKEVLKRQPIMKAKQNVIKQLNTGDIETSKWYLERKAKDEFSTKQELNNNINGDIDIKIDESDRKLLEKINKRLDNV